MDRDEFMELVYETFADEPDNVLANGIIEAADAYVEHEKAKLSQQGATKDATKDATSDLISKFIDGLEEIFADLRERHVDDSVCGLCEYDGAYIGQSGDWCNECPGFDRDDCFKLSDKTRKKWTDEIIKALPPAQPEQRWIPVSERLPKEGEVVLTQAKFKDDVKMAVSSRIDYNYWTTWGTRDINIVAWMPLPEPYQEGGEQ